MIKSNMILKLNKSIIKFIYSKKDKILNLSNSNLITLSHNINKLFVNIDKNLLNWKINANLSSI
jgi:hypothetical protein